MGTPACTTSTTRNNGDQPRAGRESDGHKTTNRQQSPHPTTTMAIPPTQLTTSQTHWPVTTTVLLLTFREITWQSLLAMSSSSCSHNLDTHNTLIMHIDISSWGYPSLQANVHSKHVVKYCFTRFTSKSSPLAGVHSRHIVLLREIH